MDGYDRISWGIETNPVSGAGVTKAYGTFALYNTAGESYPSINGYFPSCNYLATLYGRPKSYYVSPGGSPFTFVSYDSIHSDGYAHGVANGLYTKEYTLSDYVDISNYVSLSHSLLSSTTPVHNPFYYDAEAPWDFGGCLYNIAEEITSFAFDIAANPSFTDNVIAVSPYIYTTRGGSDIYYFDNTNTNLFQSDTLFAADDAYPTFEGTSASGRLYPLSPSDVTKVRDTQAFLVQLANSPSYIDGYLSMEYVDIFAVDRDVTYVNAAINPGYRDKTMISDRYTPIIPADPNIQSEVLFHFHWLSSPTTFPSGTVLGLSSHPYATPDRELYRPRLYNSAGEITNGLVWDETNTYNKYTTTTDIVFDNTFYFKLIKDSSVSVDILDIANQSIYVRIPRSPI